MRIKYPRKNLRSVIRIYHWHAFEDHGFGVGGSMELFTEKAALMLGAHVGRVESAGWELHICAWLPVLRGRPYSAWLLKWLSICRNKYRKQMQ